ncbi:SusC/RagA family TonB-linked outer membrane protein [Mucilaginibacter aquatilis]|uniref:SusC/RagA family TonB-linked outer membrane protein n=1 Tax=Mucilaginibacter aquatilis TaxID=1517760 RepID=A0A6I4IA78_9SPHI|nr:SusC/RagA family TonB-linked outer membrane protein [Mucilaginibacter aquatilis]MVN91992.1 SusC/RagA family TonB-linked outer membrane protein [Mucilaginibacter aquatilis]
MRISTPIHVLAICGSICFCTAANAQQKDSTRVAVTSANKIKNGYEVTGQVTDAATKKPVPGINVVVQDIAAAITDDKGNFKIVVPSKTSVLQFSGQGFQYKDVAVNGRKVINASLYEDGFTSAYDLVTLPFRQAPKSQISYAVTSVNTDGSWTRNKETPDNFLQGQVAGLNVIRRSGTPGVGAEVFLRGFNSLNATNQPLYVIDGMIYDANSYGRSIINGHVTNPLSNIDIKDIDNITVIKDGASYYGSRGANGVILINTAHAKELTTRIDFAAYGGMNFTPKQIPLLNTTDYRLYLTDVLRSAGQTDAQIQAQPYMNDDPANPTYYQYHNNTNWQKKVFTNSYSQNYYLKVTGGDNIAKYALSVGYLNNDGLTDSTNLKRYSTRFNADLNLTPKLTANTNLSFSSSEQILKDQGLTTANPALIGLIKAPFLSVNQISETGVQSPNLADVDIFNVSNPVSLIRNAQQTNKYYRFFGSVKFNFQFNKHHSVSSLTGLVYDKVRENTFIPRMGVVPDTLRNAIAYSRLGASIQRYNSFYNDTWYSYKRAFTGEHDVLFNAGFRYHDSESEQDYAQGYNSPTDDFVSIGNGVTNLRRLTGDYGKWKWLNAYAALNYSFRSKYFLSANLSADGSSRFGRDIPGALSIAGNKYAVLPSVAASWLISSEKFLASVKSIDLLKFRASYGLTGNDDIGNYNTRSYYHAQNLLGSQGLVLANIANPQLQWELNKKANVGLDVALFNERLNFSIDAYHNVTSKMITLDPLNTAAGMQYVIANSGGMRTNGIDLSLNSRIINNAVKLDVGLNVSTYSNRITALPADNLITNYAGATMITRIGQPTAMFYGYKTNGIYTSNNEATQAGLSIRGTDGSLVPFKGGDVRFIDVNNDKVIDDNDRQIIGNPNPDFIGSFNGKVSYKNLSLTALFTFSSGNDLYNGQRAILQSLSSPANKFANVVNRWRFDGQVTDVPRAAYGDPMGNARFSDRFIESGSYVRLRTIAVNYNLPIKPKLLKYATIYLTADNLFTVTKYLGYDPEFSAGRSPLVQGIDTALEPQFRSAQLGVRIGL